MFNGIFKGLISNMFEAFTPIEIVEANRTIKKANDAIEQAFGTFYILEHKSMP